MATADGILTEKCLNKLPSKVIYGKLDKGGQGECSDDGTMRKVEMQLKSDSIPENARNKIKDSFCYIKGLSSSSRKEEEVPEEYEFFYYFVGELLSKMEDSSKFEDAMNEVNKLITTYASELSKFFLTPDSTAKADFPTRKTVFDYHKDKNTIQGQLKGGNKWCDGTYHAHLGTINDAYETERSKCIDNRNSDWCTEFKKLFPDYASKDKLDLKCRKIEGADALHQDGSVCPDQADQTYGAHGTSGSTSSAHEGSSTDAASLESNIVYTSSALASVGLPAVAFLLYKYSSLPSWISNTLLGGGRNNITSNRKRRTFRSDFDTFTENDSTDLSTVYSMDESITEDNSTLYDGSSGRQNNRRQQQQRRRQQGQRTNMAYHKM